MVRCSKIKKENAALKVQLHLSMEKIELLQNEKKFHINPIFQPYADNFDMEYSFQNRDYCCI